MPEINDTAYRLAEAVMADLDCSDVFGHRDELTASVRKHLATTLDDAWAAAEIALPGHSVTVSRTALVASDQYVATTDYAAPKDGYAYGPTPVAALRALIVKVHDH